MKKFKRLATLVLAATMVLGLTACGKDSNNSGKVEKKDKYVIGISQPGMTHPIRVAATGLINDWLKDHKDVEVIVTDGKLDANKQIADIEDLIAKKVDLICVAAHQSPTLVGVLQQAKAAGIPIIAFDRFLTDKSVQICEVVNEDYKAGQTAAELMHEALGAEGGNIVVVQGPQGNTIVELRENGFMDKIKEYPEIKVVNEQVANFQRVQAVDLFENMYQADPSIKGVYAHNDEMALGVVKVLTDKNAIDKVKVVGVDGQKDALESVIDGKLYGTVRKVVEFPATLDEAYKYLTTGKCEPQVLLQSAKVDKSNVNDFYKADAVF